MLYKYLNPNMLLVALGDSSLDAASTPVMTVLLLDSVTGRVLHKQLQMAATGPVQLLVSENRAGAHCWIGTG